MASGGYGQLTGRQIVRLATAIPYRNMKSIALGYMDLDDAAITSLTDANRDDTEAFNREIIKMWAYKQSGNNQIQVNSPYVTFTLKRKLP